MRYPFICKCSITKYSIEFIIDTDSKSALINTIACDYIYIKAFLALLTSSISKLIYNNIETIRQSVHNEEWELYLKDKTTWNIKHSDVVNEIHEIECNIGDFIENYSIGIGLN